MTADEFARWEQERNERTERIEQLADRLTAKHDLLKGCYRSDRGEFRITPAELELILRAERQAVIVWVGNQVVAQPEPVTGTAAITLSPPTMGT